MSTPPSSGSSGEPVLSGCSAAATELLDRLGSGWAIAGAVAALRFRASPRATDDIDFLVEWDEQLVPSLLAEGFDVRVAEDEGEVQLLRIRRTDGAADLIVARTEYQDVALRRAVDHSLTVEDVIVHKLIAWRPRDRDDVASILSTGIAIDVDYVESWATQWDVLDRWVAAREGRALTD